MLKHALVLFLLVSLSKSVYCYENYDANKNPMRDFVKSTKSEKHKSGLLKRDGEFIFVPGHGFLEEAALYGYVEVVKELVSDKLLLSQEGGKALYWAASMGNVEVIQLLIKNGVNSDFTLGNGTTPLFVAAQYGEIKAMCLLLKNGAEINHKANTNFNLLELAIVEKRVGAVKVLLENGYLYKVGEKGTKELRLAKKLKNEEIIKILIDENYLLNDKRYRCQ